MYNKNFRPETVPNPDKKEKDSTVPEEMVETDTEKEENTEVETDTETEEKEDPQRKIRW